MPALQPDNLRERPFVGRAFLSLVVRRAHPGTGSDIWGLLWEDKDVERWWIEANEALKGTPHAVVGGVAAGFYMPQRFTKDLDFVVATADGAGLRVELLRRGWRLTGSLANLHPPVSGLGFRTPDGHDVDVLMLPPRYARPMVNSAARNKMGGMPMATLPWLTFLKLLAGRGQDTADVSRMLGHLTDEELAPTRRLVSKYLHGHVQDLDQMIELGRLEYGRPRRKRR